MLARIVIGCIALCALAFASLADEPKETKLKPTLVFSGTHSAIRNETFNVIATKEGWEKLWKQHRGDDFRFTESQQELNIDFETHYVVAIFTGCGELCWITPRQRGDVIAIGFDFEIFSTEGRPPEQTEHEKTKERAASSYAFVVLPKPVKLVVIEKNFEHRRGKPPLWKEQFRFPAPKDKK
ncbi:MAG: hypothetical protein L0241_00045 [Planctomycetia bacterium]|nr:hypothetical protein [Planctomycetia bacterium]